MTRVHSESEAIVIGSGPTGVACAIGLLNAGKTVLMLDVGLTLEDDRQIAVQRLRDRSPAAWRSSPEASFLKEGIGADLSGVPLKLSYGSDFPYRTIASSLQLDCNGAYISYSLARGGLSNVWGAAMLPYIDRDLSKWPIQECDLAEHYTAILQDIPIVGRKDGLASLFPLYAEPNEIPSSRQATLLLKTLEKNQENINRSGIYFGQSRLAIHHRGNEHCVQCGLCMYGCPYGLIYASSDTLSSLRRYPKFLYYSGIHVSKICEGERSATIQGKDIEADEDLNFIAERIFLAAGVVSTTSILLRSLEAYNHAIPMLDSAYFLQPAIHFSATSRVSSEPLHTLAQVFLEILDTKVCERTVHLQVYTFNELFEQAMRKVAGPFGKLLPVNALLGRLYLLQGFLHSDDSPTLVCTLKKTDSGDVLHVRANTRAHTRGILKNIQQKLMRSSRMTGLLPVTPLMRKGDPGRGFHSGGTFPMKISPSDFQTDLMGRPKGFRRIHAVDATTFPSIAATTITLTAMANAHRIATLAATL